MSRFDKVLSGTILQMVPPSLKVLTGWVKFLRSNSLTNPSKPPEYIRCSSTKIMSQIPCSWAFEFFPINEPF